MAEFGVSNALSRRKPGFNSPWDYQINQLFINLQFFTYCLCVLLCAPSV